MTRTHKGDDNEDCPELILINRGQLLSLFTLSDGDAKPASI